MPILFLTAHPALSKHLVAPVVERDFRGQKLPPGSVELPELADDAAHDVLKLFKSLVTQLAEANETWDGWWYTWLSSRDRHNSRLFEQMIYAERVRNLLRSTTAQALTLKCHDPTLAAALTRIARETGWQVQGGAAVHVCWLVSGLGSRLAPFIAAAKLIRRGVLGFFAAHSNPHAAGTLTGHKLLIVSLFGRNALPRDGESFTDTYFAELPRWFARRGIRTLVLGEPDASVAEVTHAVAHWRDPAVCTPAHLTGLWDVLASSVKATFVPRRALQINLPQDSWLRPLLRADLRRDAVSRGSGYLLKCAMDRVLAQNPDARVLHMYENNPWERAIAQAAHATIPPRDVTGYLHCAVLPAHLKNYISTKERRLRPAPDKIVCTGPAARTVFLGLGEHAPDKVLAGCALRDTAARLGPMRKVPPNRIETVLVLLEGLEKMVGLLRFAAAAASCHRHIRFVVREHPAMPLAQLTLRSGVSVGGEGQIEASAAADLELALDTADAVIYQGTTAALAAGYLGVPLIRFVVSGILTDDPLFACPALKRKVYSPDELPAIFAEFEGMDGPSWDRETIALRAYLEDYLAPVTAGALAAFGMPPDFTHESTCAALT